MILGNLLYQEGKGLGFGFWKHLLYFDYPSPTYFLALSREVYQKPVTQIKVT
jgi:hypothetical protein